MRTGILYAIAAYAIWGVLPIYLKALRHVSPLEILLHRVVWSFAFLLAVLAARRRWGWLKPALRSPAVVGRSVASAALLSVNWLVYIWAVNSGRVVDASLGYFITPLINVLFGVVLLRERLRPGQWLSVAMAGTGVVWLTARLGELPWVSLVLAVSFGSYGLLRKTSSLGALEGLTLETVLLSPLAAAVLGRLHAGGQTAFGHADAGTHALLLLAGPITAVPLLLFAAGMRRIPLSLLGILQYVSPTLQFLLGVFLYQERFDAMKLVGFLFIWSAVAVYSAEGLRHGRVSRDLA
jgi:chloramphenicol-sensitive protein RarD